MTCASLSCEADAEPCPNLYNCIGKLRVAAPFIPLGKIDYIRVIEEDLPPYPAAPDNRPPSFSK